MIRLAGFFGKEFDQNGDLGNLEVLGRALAPHGSAVQTLMDVRDPVLLTEAEFLVIGDASRAHQRKRSFELQGLHELIVSREKNCLWSLVVGSTYEQLAADHFGFEVQSTRRISAFASSEFGDREYWGYLNTEVLVPRFVIQGTTIGTQFFGPLLARNPVLVSEIAESSGWQVDLNYLEKLQSLMDQSPNSVQARKSHL